MKLRILLLTSFLASSVHAAPKTASCDQLDLDLLRQNHGVLSGSSRRGPEQLREVSLSTDFKFFDGAKFRGKYPQFNAEWVPVSEWLVMDPQYAEQIAMKHRAYQGREKAKIFRWATDQQGLTPAQKLDAQKFANHMLVETVKHFQTHFGDRFAAYYNYTESTGRLESKITGEVWNIKKPAVDPLEILGKITQEDQTIIMQDAQGTYRLVGGFVANPTNWRLADFLGWSVFDIHVKSAGLSEKFAGAIDKALTLYHVGSRVTGRMQRRNNWFVVFDPQIVAGYRSHFEFAEQITKDNLEQNVFIRMEGETMRAFKVRGVDSRFISFTIQPHVYDLPSIAGRPVTKEIILGIHEVNEGKPNRESAMVQDYLLKRLPQTDQEAIIQELRNIERKLGN